MLKVIGLIALCVLCFIGGAGFMAYGCALHSVGRLRVDRSDEDGPYLFAEFDKPLSYISRQKFVLLDVKDKGYIEEAAETLRIK